MEYYELNLSANDGIALNDELQAREFFFDVLVHGRITHWNIFVKIFEAYCSAWSTISSFLTL